MAAVSCVLARRSLVASVALTGCLCLLGAVQTSAQTRHTQPGEAEPPPRRIRGQLGIAGLVGVPFGEFADNISTTGGVSGYVGARLGESIVSLGGEFGFLPYGSETRTVPLSTTIPDILVDVNTNNSIILTHARVRVQRREGRLRPYLDGLFGFNYVFTRTSVDLDGFDDVTDTGTTNLSDFGLSYGGGGGTLLTFESWPSSLSLDFSSRFVAGSEADYLTQGAIRREAGQTFQDVSRSRTDLFVFSVGLVWEP